MQLETVRFGRVLIDDKKILSFGEGLPGLEEYKKFAILRLDESYPIVWLQSVEDSAVCLPVIDSFLALPDYSFDINDADADELQLNEPEDVQVLSVLVIPDNMEAMTMNLAAPIIINLQNGMAKQIILSNGEHNVRFPIFRDIIRLFKEVSADAGAVKED